MATIGACVLLMLGWLWSASASVHLMLKPAGTAVAGGRLELELWGASDAGAVMVAGVDAVLGWDPGYLGGVDVVESVFEGYSEFPSELPFPINFSLSDGNAFYSAVLAIGQGRVEVNETGVSLARFGFVVRGLSGRAGVGIVADFDGLGQVPELASTAVWDRDGINIVGAMGWGWIDVLPVPEPGSFLFPLATAAAAVIGLRRSK